MEKQDVMSVLCKVTRTLLKEEKSRTDAVCVTTFAGIAEEGMFTKYSKNLESAIFGKQFWETITTGELQNQWIMRLTDVKTNQQFVEIKGCSIKNIKLKRGKENLIEAGFVIQHNQTPYQGALEAAISTTVMMLLSIDDTVMEDSKNETAETTE